MGVAMDTTPITYIPDRRLWLKRDDLYERAGAYGGKVRTCWTLATRALPDGAAVGLVTASSRKSPQAQMVARIAQALGIPARCHMPTGQYTEEMYDIQCHGADIVQHRPGHNSVIIARAKADAQARPGWRYIPFGMEDPAAVQLTAAQVVGIPPGVRRLVVTVGSGMSLAGILHGLNQQGRVLPVLGVCVGADPRKRLCRYVPMFFARPVTLVQAPEDYHEAVQASVGGVVLDPYYEAKAAQYLRPDDLFWVVGKRTTEMTTGAE